MKIVLEPRRTYVPRLNGNRQLPETEQLKVHYRQPNAIERRQYRIEKYDQVNGLLVVELDAEKILSRQDVTIENLQIELVESDKPLVKEISTGTELIRVPAKFTSMLTEELVSAIMGLDISDELLKNSVSASEQSSGTKESGSQPSTTPSP